MLFYAGGLSRGILNSRVASSPIPAQAGDRVKTGHRDALMPENRSVRVPDTALLVGAATDPGRVSARSFSGCALGS